MDKKTLDIRPKNKQTLHTKNKPTQIRRLKRLHKLLQPQKTDMKEQKQNDLKPLPMKN